MASANYTAKDITVLEGLEPVRKRPGMYIGGVGKEGLHHLVWEIVDNSVDEAINGYATNIQVTLQAGGKAVTVDDNGRGTGNLRVAPIGTARGDAVTAPHECQRERPRRFWKRST